MILRPSLTIRQHAQRLVDSLNPTDRAHLAANPLRALEQSGLTVTELEASQHAQRWCDGLSTTEGGIVMYLATPDSRRENFTLLHEFAHLVVERDEEAMIWLADQPDDRAATEALCNAVAGMLLVPTGVLDALVGDGPILAQHLLDLQNRTAASQPASAIALARRLGTAGAVVIIDRASATVAHAALVGELPIWPWKDQRIPATHPLGRITPGTHLQLRSWWATPWGDRQTYYLDAVATLKRSYAILAETDIWNVEQFHGGDELQEREKRPSSSRTCRCGYSGLMTGWPCQTCNQNFCPKCKTCLCDARDAAASRCSNCTVSYAPTALVGGLCSECR